MAMLDTTDAAIAAREDWRRKRMKIKQDGAARKPARLSTADRVYALRMKHGMTQQEFARWVGLSGASEVSLLERGHRKATMRSAKLLAPKLGLKRWWILLEEEGDS